MCIYIHIFLCVYNGFSIAISPEMLFFLQIEMDGNEELMLNWSNHHPTLVHEVASLRHAVRYNS